MPTTELYAIEGERLRKPVFENGLIGMIAFVLSEAMMFMGLVSAFTIARASAVTWPPPGQPRLPVEQTAFNTLVLLASGAMILLAARAFRRDRATVGKPLFAAIALGTFFVAFQGMEWVRLLGQGLTLTSSAHGSFFYLIIGMHGLHAVAGIIFLAVLYLRAQRLVLTQSALDAGVVFWGFVVLVWPVLYLRVYL